MNTTMPQPTAPEGTLRDALFLRLPPVWLRGTKLDHGTPLRGMGPPSARQFRPLTLWALFDHPVTGVQLQVGAAPQDRHVWLGFQTTVFRVADASRAQLGLVRGLQSANLPKKTPKPGSESPEPLPPHGYLLQVPPDRRDAPRSDLGDLYNPTLCDLVESLSARGNRAVLDIRVRTSTAHPVLAEAIDAWYASRDTMNRTIESIDIPEERMAGDVDRLEQVQNLMDGLGAFEVEVRLFTEQPVEPRELQWALQQLEQTVQPRGRWTTEARDTYSSTINVFALDNLIGMQWAEDNRPPPEW